MDFIEIVYNIIKNQLNAISVIAVFDGVQSN